LQAWQAAGVSEYLGYDSSFRFGPLAQDFRNTALALSMTRTTARTTWQTSISNAVDVIDQREFADYAHTHRQTLDTRLSSDLGTRQSLSAGAVFSREATASDSFGTQFDVQTRQQLYYLQDQLHLGQTELLLVTGLTQHQAFGAHRSWNAELNRALGMRWRFTAAAGSAFHAPDSTDRYGYGGNPQLLPERSEQAELGLYWLPAAGQSLAMNAFDTRLRDLVTFELTDPLTFSYQNRNVERARIRGVELSYQAAVGRWSVGAAATFQQPRNLSSGELLLRRARQHFDLRLGWQGGRLGGFGALLISAPRTDADFNTGAPVQLPGYALLNLGASLQLSPSWLLQARLDNALDRDYQLANGYNTPRRSAYLAARYRWR
jgi:vitamin B12 transporter